MILSINDTRWALLAVILLSLTACSGGSKSSRIDYKEVKALPSLEVPPDLAIPMDTGTDNIPEPGSADDAPGGANGTGRILPLGEGIEIARDGSARWLVIDATPSQLWSKLQQFWPTLGLELKVDNPTIGIMETDWAENRADAPSGFLARMIKKVFKNAYSADTRDKYRLRLEPMAGGRTELYVTHYGLKEVVATDTGEFVETAWQVRPSDPELANEVLNRLIIYLGGGEQTAKAVLDSTPKQQPSRARLVDGALVMDEGFSRAWRLTGIALDRAGLVVVDRNRSEGIYYVTRVDQLVDAGLKEEGWFSSLFSSEGEDEQDGQKQWQVYLSGGDTSTRIRLRDEQGGPVPPELNRSVLQKLQESLH